METRTFLAVVIVLLFWLAPKPDGLRIMPAASDAATPMRMAATRVEPTKSSGDAEAIPASAVRVVAPE